MIGLNWNQVETTMTKMLKFDIHTFFFGFVC